jgi:FMN phosphatase YigB (HAD superfamily)
LNAEECVFIDDGPANVESAKRVGMQGLLVEKDSDWWDKLSEILNE